MRYGSVCSGIEAATLAWEPLGWEAAWFAEIEAFPSKVLAHRWPNVPNMGDMCQLPMLIRAGLVEAPDVLVGGTPCQAYSVAGKREGLSDARGQLTLTYVEVADAIDSQRPGNPCVVVWENVPGVLSSKDNAFGCFLGDLVGEDCPLEPPGGKWTNAGCVYGPTRTAAWRVVDAQYFGVAQRRRRVFVVASAREEFNPTEVLFEREGVRRDTSPWVGTTPQHTGISGERTFDMLGFGQYGSGITASTCKLRDYKDATDLVVTADGRVRRLTPTECERLQGMPDNHTNIPGAADGPRYKAIGNFQSRAVRHMARSTHREVLHMITRRLQPDDRVSDLLSVALDIARTEGFNAVTRKRVAQAARVSPSLVTFRFLSTALMRDAVMQAAVDRGDLRVVADGITLRHAAALAAPAEMRAAALTEALTA